jgi:DNA polymerase-3 subunit epsilon
MDMLNEALKLLGSRLALARPLVFLDLEGTGVNPQLDRIVQVGVLKLKPSGDVTTWCSLVNPEVPIPPGATKVHGITDQDVAEAPTFRVIAPALADGLDACDLVAFNGRRYDLELLACEFGRVKITWGPTDPKWTGQLVDPYQLWMRREPRNLEAYAARYGGVTRQPGEGHRADQDVVDLVLGFAGHLMADPTLPATIPDLVDASRDPTWLDPDGKIKWQDGVPVLGFGKQAGQPLQQVPRDYLAWMLGKDFSPAVKQIVRARLQGHYPTPPSEVTPE